MDVMKMLDGLREERDRVNEAVAVLERLASGQGGKRRGRPPKWMQEIKAKERLATEMDKWKPEPRPKKHKSKAKANRKFSARTRRKMAASQRRRWAIARKEVKV